MKIAIVMAMREEAAPLIAELGFQPVEKPWRDGASPALLFRACRPRAELDLILSGVCDQHQVDLIGTQAATLAAHLAVTECGADILVNAGTAGGFIARGGKIGSVYLGYDRVLFHDRRIDLPGFDAYGVGAYPTPDTREIAKQIGVEVGVVSSGNSLDCPPQDFEFMKRHEVVAKEMEAAAIAWVARLHSRPLYLLKSITDLVDSGHPTSEEFLKNLHHARTTLTKRLVDLLGVLESLPSPHTAT